MDADNFLKIHLRRILHQGILKVLYSFPTSSSEVIVVLGVSVLAHLLCNDRELIQSVRTANRKLKENTPNYYKPFPQNDVLGTLPKRSFANLAMAARRNPRRLGKNKQKSAGAPALVYRRGRDAAPETFEKEKTPRR